MQQLQEQYPPIATEDSVVANTADIKVYYHEYPLTV